MKMTYHFFIGTVGTSVFDMLSTAYHLISLLARQIKITNYLKLSRQAASLAKNENNSNNIQYVEQLIAMVVQI